MRRALALLLTLGLIAGAFALPPPSEAVCKTVVVNEKGTGNASITVDATAGGVTVLDAKTVRCGATLYNSGSAAMRCAPTTVTVTATVGHLIPVGTTLILGAEAQQAWKCIRTTGTNTTVDVAEAMP